MKILVCAPTSREYRAMRFALDKAQGLKHSYELREVGIGKALSSAGVARALTLAEAEGVKFDMLAVVGFAAAALGRKQGDIVMPSRAIHHDAIIPEGFCPEITDPRKLCGSDAEAVFTGDSFVNADIVREIKTRLSLSWLLSMSRMSLRLATLSTHTTSLPMRTPTSLHSWSVWSCCSG